MLSRRQLLAGAAASAFATLSLKRSSQALNENTYQLPAGLEVIDYRLFPSPNAKMFIVEVRNNTDEAFDTPSLGVVLPRLDPAHNFGWAVPIQGVLRPHDSSALIGVAPDAIVDDDDWGNPEWTLCNEISTRHSEAIASFDVDISAELDPRDGANMAVYLTIRNNGRPLNRSVTVLGIVRDAGGRICGGTYPVALPAIAPGTQGEIVLWLGSYFDYNSSHSALLNSADEVTIAFSLQPWPKAVNPGCSPAMPWNR